MAEHLNEETPATDSSGLSDGIKIESQPSQQAFTPGDSPAPAKVKKKQVRKFSLIWLDKRVTAFFSIMAKAFVIGLISVAFLFIGRELASDRYVIQQVNVPEAFGEAGYTGPVVAQLISMKLNDIIRRTGTTEIAEEYKSDTDIADVQVDMVGMGVPVRGVVELIGSAIGIDRKKKINAVITIDGHQAVLIIHQSGALPQRFEVPMDVNLGVPMKVLVADAAEDILKNTNSEILNLYYTRLRDSQKTIELAKYRLEKYKNDPKMEAKALCSWAMGLLFEGKTDLALTKVNEALALSKTESDVFRTQANIQAAMGDLAGALESDKKSYELLDPQAPNYRRVRILNNISVDFAGLKQYDSSIYYCQRTIDLDHEYNSAYYNLAIFQLLKKDTTHFFETMEIALSKGYPISPMLQDVDLNGVLNHPRFKQLVAKYSDQ